MVKISVDEAYAFDILSIFEVKTSSRCDGEKAKLSQFGYDLLLTELVEQLGHEKASAILGSEEYKNLLDANFLTFDLVDVVRKNKEDSIGKNIDDANVKRFVCKQKLQEAFFENKLVEVKTQI